MRSLLSGTAVILALLATPALADFAKIESEDAFMSVIKGKELRRPFVRLQVSPTGDISGVGAARPVTGKWSWRDGYFCRDLFWGGDPLGHNCQEVQAHHDRIRFTSDKGQGDSAEFRLD